MAACIAQRSRATGAALPSSLLVRELREMCGIVGFASARGDRRQNWLERAVERLVHRGPDDGAIWYSADHTAGLGHRRLAVLDLTAAGRQPMHRPPGLHIAFNGEIYNFRELRQELEGPSCRFATRTDTEVVLAAYERWGPACLGRLKGMFSFALYDEPRRRLLLARDRAGEKPLFYRHAGAVLTYASELKALLADPATPRTLEPAALEFYLAYGYVPAPHCILTSVRKLGAGEAALYDQRTDRLYAWRYWELPARARNGGSVAALTDEYDRLLENAVRRQLVADVPVGILLSGGLDSSLVAAMAARVSSEPVRTFTVSMAGHPRYDESRYARLVADHLGTRHAELVAEPASVELLSELARQYDEPLADSSMVPTYLISRMIRASATVALGGDGGDELFGGYNHYSWLQWQSWFRQLVPAAGRALMGRAGTALPLGVRGRNHIAALGSDLRRSMAHINLYFDAPTRPRVFGTLSAPHRPADDSPERFKMALWREGLSAADNAMRIDFATYLADNLLVKVDRASMLASLEVRSPYLDTDMIEFAFSAVPDSCKVAGRERKILSRRLGERLLPPALDLRRKQGFSLPLDAWFKGAWGRYMRQVLADSPRDLIAPAAVRDLFAGQEKGRNNMHRIYALTMLELWRREYDITTDLAAASSVGMGIAG